MKNLSNDELATTLFEMIGEICNPPIFTILEIGAVPLDEEPEPFHALLDFFPKSKVIAFEIDEELCDDLNKKAKPGLKYFPVAVGRTEESRLFYETEHPMCCSLYKPNEELVSRYHEFQYKMIKTVSSINTVSLDYFIRKNNIGSIDFIKIDIEGAELDVFKGGINTLKDVLAIVTEVEFVLLHHEQPLFGDVSSYLTKQELMFHKFLGFGSRNLKPMVLENNPNIGTQHLWADALFIKEFSKSDKLSSAQLLKIGILAFIYGSHDVSYICFELYDERENTNIHEALRDLFQNPDEN